MEIMEGVQLLRGLGDRCSGGRQGHQRSGVQKNGKAGSEIITYMISEIAKIVALGEYSELYFLKIKDTVAWASKLGDFRGEGRIVACKIMNF